jgi:hypothetical protein
MSIHVVVHRVDGQLTVDLGFSLDGDRIVRTRHRGPLRVALLIIRDLAVMLILFLKRRLEFAYAIITLDEYLGAFVVVA